jgi:SAM-dependent methyltransferase
MPKIVNVDMANAWNGDEGAGWVKEWERYDDSIRAYRYPLLEAAAIRDGERVLDIGCGNGQTSRDVARATPSGSALGADISGPMLDQARRQAEAEGLRNVEFVEADAQVHPFEPGAFDLVVSRFGSMFFADRVAAFSNIGRALRPGGRLLFMVWQPVAKNEQFVTLRQSLAAGRDLPTPPPTAPSPFGLSDPELGRGWLTDAGFTDIVHTPVELPFSFGSDADDAFAFAKTQGATRGLLDGLDDETAQAALATLHDAFRARETADGVVFQSATWFISARRP